MAALTTFTAQTVQTAPYILPGSGNTIAGVGGFANCSFCSGFNGDCIASYTDMVQCATTGSNCDNIFPCPTAPMPGSAGGTLNALINTTLPVYTIPGGLWNTFQSSCGSLNTSQSNQCSNVNPGLCPVPSGTPVQESTIPIFTLAIPNNSGHFLSPGVTAGSQVINTYFINAPTYYDSDTLKPATVGCDYNVTWFKTVADINAFTSAFTNTDPNFNINYGSILSNLCTQVYTATPANPCPVDSLTNLPMTQCSYFLAQDPGGIGNVCRAWINDANTTCAPDTTGLVNAAMDNFCQNPATSAFPECLCINRTSNLIYQQASNKATAQQDDYCWWVPCKNTESTIYLTPTLPNCQGPTCANICEVIVKNYDNNVGGNSAQNINSYINCPGIGTSGGNPPPPPDHAFNWLLILAIGAIILIIIIVALTVISRERAKRASPTVTV